MSELLLTLLLFYIFYSFILNSNKKLYIKIQKIRATYYHLFKQSGQNSLLRLAIVIILERHSMNKNSYSEMKITGVFVVKA